MDNAARKAIEVLAERGWTRTSLRTTEGYCLLGAWAVALGIDVPLNREGHEAIYGRLQDEPSIVLLGGVIAEQYPDIGGGDNVDRCYTLNDWAYGNISGLTRADLDRVLDKAAVRLDEDVTA